MVSAEIVAKFILSLSRLDVGDIILNLKLQKLLYYCQGFHLALFNKPLFPEQIEKWQHGPAVPEIYSLYKKYGDKALPVDKWDVPKILIKQVYENYGQFSAWRLVEMTHKEPPWENAQISQTITQESLNSYFKTCLEDG